MWVNAFDREIIRQLLTCDGFMWRFDHKPVRLAVAQRVMPVVELQMGLSVFPDSRTAWHYDDKIAQHYLLAAAEIPAPRTWVFWDRNEANELLNKKDAFPLVVKLACGASSRNVRVAHQGSDIAKLIGQAFGAGLFRMDLSNRSLIGEMKARTRATLRALLGRDADAPGDYERWHHGYLYLQEFLEGNEFDTRITVIGNRAFGFRRFNRPDDFRASGSGIIDHDPKRIDEAFIRLGFRTARAIQSQSCAIDGLYRNGEPVVCEISYTYASWAVRQCPGHWQLLGDPEDGELVWREGGLAPETAIADDFLDAMERRRLLEEADVPTGVKV